MTSDIGRLKYGPHFENSLFSTNSARLSSSIDEKIVKWAIISENKVGVFIPFKQKLFIYGEWLLKDTTFKMSFDCNETTIQTVKQS